MWQKLRMQDLCIMVKPGILGRILCTYLQPVPRADEVRGCSRHGRLSLLLVMKVIVRHFFCEQISWGFITALVVMWLFMWAVITCWYSNITLKSLFVEICICSSRWEMVWFWLGPSSFTVVAKRLFVKLDLYILFSHTKLCPQTNEPVASMTTSRSSPLDIKHWNTELLKWN